MKNQIIKHLKGKYPTETICKVFDYLHSLANKGDLLPQGTKSTLCSAGQAKLFNDYIDKTPGESLRQLKELQQEIRRDHAIVLNGIYTEELGLVSAKLSSIEKEIAALADLGGNGRNHHPLDRLFTCGRHLINMQQLPPFLFLRPDGYDVHAFRQIARFESGGFHANK